VAHDLTLRLGSGEGGSLWGATVEETVFLGSARHYMGMFLLGIFNGI